MPKRSIPSPAATHLLLLLSMLMPTQACRTRETVGVVVQRDLAYVATDPHPRHRLDVYASEGADGLPVLVYLHGGGWSFGDKRVLSDNAAALAEAGFVVVVPNYRLSPEVQHPEHVRDVAAAIAWVRRHIGAHGGDGDTIFVMGHSAGAHLAALVATDPRWLAEHDLGRDALRGAVLLDGAGYDIPRQVATTSWPRLQRLYLQAFGTDESGQIDASPVHQVRPGDDLPPVLIWHAGQRLGAATQATLLAEAIRRVGGRATVEHAPEDNHMTLNRQMGEPDDPQTQTTLQWLRAHSR